MNLREKNIKYRKYRMRERERNMRKFVRRQQKKCNEGNKELRRFVTRFKEEKKKNLG